MEQSATGMTEGTTALAVVGLAALATLGPLGSPGVVPAVGEAEGPGPAGQQAPAISFAGENGLAVFLEGDEVVVRWLTDGAVPGVLEAVADGKTIRRDTTPAGLAHETRFRRPETSEVLLRYGVADAAAGTDDGGPPALHETRIRLDKPSSTVDATVEGVDSLFVVGDVHGQYDRLRSLLRNAGLVGEDGGWTGGSSHLVFLGDLFDRGPDVTRTLWFIYGLEREARAAGGRVHVVLGNHEIMVLTGDLRYVSGKETLVASRHGMEYSRLFDVQRSLLGRWLASKPAALSVDDVLLVHGGIGPAYEDRSVEALNDTLRAYVSEDLFRRWADSTVQVAPVDSAALERRIQFFFDAPSVFWYRSYVSADTLGDRLGRMLDRHGATLHVVAHTPVPTIREKYGGRLILVDLQRPASELLLLVRRGDGWERRVYGLEGEARPLEGSAAEGAPGARPDG